MEKIFIVEYNSYDEVINMNCNQINCAAEDNLKKQIEFTKKLKRQGYSHIQDQLNEIYSGEKLCTIDDYILELTSYL